MGPKSNKAAGSAGSSMRESGAAITMGVATPVCKCLGMWRWPVVSGLFSRLEDRGRPPSGRCLATHETPRVFPSLVIGLEPSA